MCGAPDQDSLPTLEVSAAEAVVHGHVTSGGQPVAGAYVRLLDSTGEFTAEVQTSATGYFRFYAADGPWTLRTLSRGAEPVDTTVTAEKGKAVPASVEIPS